MLAGVYRLLSVFAAWFTALCFLRKGLRSALLHAGLTALVYSLAAYWLTEVSSTGWLLPFQAVIFLLSALAAGFRDRRSWGAALHAFLIAQGCFAILGLPLRCLAVVGQGALWMGAACCCLFLGLTLWLRDRFPVRSWRETFTDRSDGPLPLRWQLMYGIPLILCLLLSASGALQPLTTLLACGLSLLVSSVALWLGLWIMILLPAYGREMDAVQAEKQYRGEMQSFLNVIRSQRHDYNFHVQTIAGLIRQGQVAECLRYVNALEEDSAVMNAVLPVKDPAISAMIHNFQMLAVREGIELHIDIHYDLSQIATNVYETNKIISNLLQNAIDETSGHTDKSHGIWLTILKRGEYCVIRVSNRVERIPSAGDLGRIYTQGYTTKQGHDGVGLSSLRTLTERYHGTIYTQLEGDEIHFVVRIPINYAKPVIS